MVETSVDASVEDSETLNEETQEAGADRRERSSVAFAYTPLSDALEVAKAVGRRGHACTVDELAAELNQQMTSGAFRSKLASARLFGVIDTSRGTVSLTEIGRRVLRTDTQAQALVDSFLNVPLYRLLYDQFAGCDLPPDHGLEAAMRRHGVPEKQTAKARQVLFRSAEVAGFLNSGRNRLVRPVTSVSQAEAETTQSDGQGSPASRQLSMAEHPLIKGLVAKLPPEGERFTPQQRRRWLEAARINLELIYAADDEEPSSADQHL